MHIHILGICGTFMGGIALLARAAGHRVTGCDTNVYPPMSTQLIEQGIDLIEGYAVDQVNLAPDLFLVGNAISRGNPLLEEILDRSLPYTSAPQWLAENILNRKWVLAVAGTHGKTTTSSMLAWILEYAGYAPSFLIGGVPVDFGVSARHSDSQFFVIEADEYDTAFCDKRSKFVHYRARTTILNNLEFDHADIFADLCAIETQFHHLVRIMPRSGLIVANAEEASLERVLARGTWSAVEKFNSPASWAVDAPDDLKSQESYAVRLAGNLVGALKITLPGAHNRSNALAAIVAARHAGVPPQIALEALAGFRGIKRRLEVRGAVNGITVYDDFAHHPTAFELTLAGLRQQQRQGRIFAVVEPRSNTMKLGIMKDRLAASLALADRVLCYAANLGWDAKAALLPLGEKADAYSDLEKVIATLVSEARTGDHLLIMSNGGFGSIHEKLLAALRASSQ